MRTRRVRRAAAALAACAVAAGTLAGCGSGGDTDSNGKVTINFMEAMSAGTLGTSMTELVRRFHQQNPNITVNLEVEPDYPTLHSKETAAVSAHKPPTIAQAYEGWAAEYQKSDVIDSLDSYATKDDLAKLYPGVRDDQYLPGKKLYMWPFNKSVIITYYNQQMLAAKGLSAPKTWDEFAADAKAVSGNGTVGTAIEPGTSAGPAGGEAWYEILAAANGKPVFSADGKPQFTSPEAVKALQWLVDLKKAGAMTVGTKYPAQVALGGGKGLFDVSTVASFFYEQKAVGGKFPLGTAPVPAGPKGTANQLAGTNIVMFSAADDAQKKAAWKFMKFLDSADSQAYWASHSGYLPVTPDALPKMTDFIAKNPYQKFAADSLATAKSDPPYSWVTKTQGDLAVAMQAALSGQQTPEAALAAAQKQATDDMKSDKGN